MNWNAAPGFVIVKLELEKSSPVAELVTCPSIPPRGVTATPSFKQTTPGAAFQFTQTVSGPGLSNHTIIQRETTVTSVTDTTSIFQQ